MLRRYLFLAIALTLLTSSSASATPVTLVFQHGSEVTRNAVGTGVTYAGTIDTVVLDNDNIDRGGDPSFGVDSSATSSTGNDQDSLLGFGDLFGATLDRIPAGSTITSATLHLVQNSGFGEGGVANARRMLVSWTEADTWQSLTTSGIGLQSNGVEVRTTDSFTIPGGIRFVRSEYDRDVMADIQFWSDNPTQNFGWALLPLGMGGRGEWTSRRRKARLSPITPG